MKVAVVLAAVGLAAPIPGVAHAEATLQGVFDSFFGAGVVDTTQETGLETFQAGSYSFTLVDKVTANPDVPLGWYPTSDPTQFNEIFPAAATPSTTADVNVPVEFGLSVRTFETWFSEASLNLSDSFDHFKTFDVAIPSGGIAVGLEDVPGGGDQDFQAFVFFFAPTRPAWRLPWAEDKPWTHYSLPHAWDDRPCNSEPGPAACSSLDFQPPDIARNCYSANTPNHWVLPAAGGEVLAVNEGTGHIEITHADGWATWY